MTITVIVNGKEETVPEDMSLLDYVNAMGLDPNRIVVEHNAAILAREDLDGAILKENDRLEILRFVGGG